MSKVIWQRVTLLPHTHLCSHLVNASEMAPFRALVVVVRKRWPVGRLPAWGFLLMFYDNHSPKMRRFWARGMGQTYGRTDERLASLLNAVGWRWRGGGAGMCGQLAQAVQKQEDSVLVDVFSERDARRRCDDQSVADRRSAGRQLQRRQRHHRHQLTPMAAHDRPTRSPPTCPPSLASHNTVDWLIEFAGGLYVLLALILCLFYCRIYWTDFMIFFQQMGILCIWNSISDYWRNVATTTILGKIGIRHSGTPRQI